MEVAAAASGGCSPERPQVGDRGITTWPAADLLFAPCGQPEFERLARLRPPLEQVPPSAAGRLDAAPLADERRVAEQRILERENLEPGRAMSTAGSRRWSTSSWMLDVGDMHHHRQLGRVSDHDRSTALVERNEATGAWRSRPARGSCRSRGLLIKRQTNPRADPGSNVENGDVSALQPPKPTPACLDGVDRAFRSPAAPETSTRCALTQLFSSDSSKAIIDPTCSGWPTRLSGDIAETISFTSGSSRTMPPLKSVAMAPGATVLAVIPRDPTSLAMYRVSTSTAPFIAP